MCVTTETTFLATFSFSSFYKLTSNLFYNWFCFVGKYLVFMQLYKLTRLKGVS